MAFGNGGILIGLILFAALGKADGGLGFGSGRTGVLFSLFGPLAFPITHSLTLCTVAFTATLWRRSLRALALASTVVWSG